MKLSEETRSIMIHGLAERQMESLQDYNSREFYHLAIDGLKGLKDETDKELVAEYIEMRKSCSCEMPEQDPTLRALYGLKKMEISEEEARQIDLVIEDRRRELNYIESKPGSLCDECVKITILIDRAKKELGL